ncbi:PIN domain-containing protein [Streptomyces sp. NPDC047022]|uniref:PIN domain-containing protein n=1 Tax=Streptomyces sp. NPDC047022 TaxID=3155737 RepID=UPI0033FDC379
MIVVLDTTAFSSDFTCSGTAWRVLAHAGAAWGLRIYVPEVVVAEAIGGYEREIQNVTLALDKPATKYAGRLGLREYFDNATQELNALREEYPSKLAARIEGLGGVVLPPPDVSHIELAKRAASRRKPCDQKGDGYRDTLNWLLVLQLAQENPEDSVYWVTENTTDFTDEEKQGFHPDLLDDIEAIGARERVRWANDLASLLLSLAASHYNDSADDIRKVRDRLQQGAISEFIDEVVLASVVKRGVTARRCGLPLDTLSPEILAVQGVRDLELAIRGVAEKGGAFAEFTFTAEVLIGLDLVESVSELPEGLEAAEGIGKAATVLKALSFGGLIELDEYGRPVSGEVSKAVALPGDPGLEQWKGQPSGLASLQSTLAKLRSATVIDPKILDAMRPKIDPKFAELMRPKIDPKFAELMRPKIDPAIFESLFPKLDIFKGSFGLSGILRATSRYHVASVDDDSDADTEEPEATDGDDEDPSDTGEGC